MNKSNLNIKKIIKANINAGNVPKRSFPVLNKKDNKNIVRKQEIIKNMSFEYRETPKIATSKQERSFASGDPNFGVIALPRFGVYLFNKREELIENEKYIIKENVDYDVLIITGSYNRYEFIEHQINSFMTQESKYKFKFIVLNDGSDDIRYDSLKEKYPSIIYLKNDKPNGKVGYWKTISRLLQECKNYTAHAILQIDDDFYICKSFINKMMDLFFLKKNENYNVMGISYHLYDKSHTTQDRWGGRGGSWADGGGLYDYDFFKKSGFKINEIPLNRWGKNIGLSTGVWEQVSRSINYIDCVIYKTPFSYVKHEGHSWGSMERQDKNEFTRAITYNFIDDE